MQHDFQAILTVHVTGEGKSKQEALARAVQTHSYEIISAKISNAAPPKYISTAEYARRVGLKGQTYISKLCAQGAIPGAIRVGRSYAIPEDTPYIDRRVTDGSYKGTRSKYYRAHLEKVKARREAGLPDPEPRKPSDHPIAKARMAKGWTQAQLADAMGVNTGTISNWESGFRKPKASSLQRIADTLGVPVDTLTQKEPRQ